MVSRLLSLIEPIENHPGTAAWVQAVGAIIALFIAIWIPRRQQRLKDPRTARLPPLTIFDANAGKLGLLTDDEIVPLIAFSGTPTLAGARCHPIRSAAPRFVVADASAPHAATVLLCCLQTGPSPGSPTAREQSPSRRLPVRV